MCVKKNVRRKKQKRKEEIRGLPKRQPRVSLCVVRQSQISDEKSSAINQPRLARPAFPSFSTNASRMLTTIFVSEIAPLEHVTASIYLLALSLATISIEFHKTWSHRLWQSFHEILLPKNYAQFSRSEGVISPVMGHNRLSG